jgi:hypothetical protein
MDKINFTLINVNSENVGYYTFLLYYSLGLSPLNSEFSPFNLLPSSKKFICFKFVVSQLLSETCSIHTMCWVELLTFKLIQYRLAYDINFIYYVLTTVTVHSVNQYKRIIVFLQIFLASSIFPP